MRTVGTIALLLALGATAHADDKALAKEAFREGARQYDLGEYRKALELFKKAYLNFEEPLILFNTAQCERQLGNKAEAVKLYRSYLRKSPEAPNRAEVDRIIQRLEIEIAEETATKTTPPQGTLSPDATHQPPPAAVPPPAPLPLAVDRGRGLRIGGLVLGATGVAMVLVGGVFTAEARSANDAISRPGIFHPDDEDRRNTFEKVDLAFYIVGGVAIGAGLTLYLVGRKAVEPSLRSAAGASAVTGQ